ncbi:TOX high mobility group box family member 3-like isoform X2 [Anneissia japonica]|uniref:TOX high mobility group box family member 3-like isoform X2 n=1 Tax=Anneissia japonica TaxID=1529436 RepID=UPI001425AAD2|nr:TOX high mobility group box family member 3-like isoform X2 [Anneissia japonica]
MSETFHTPSFGDDEFTIPQISPPATTNISSMPFDAPAPVSTSFRDSLADASFPGEGLPESSQGIQQMTPSQRMSQGSGGMPPGGAGIPPVMSQPVITSNYTTTTTQYTQPLSHITEALPSTTGTGFSHNAVVNPQFPPQNVFIPPITENESFFRQETPSTTFHMSNVPLMYSQEQPLSQFSTISHSAMNDQLGMQLGRMQGRGMAPGLEHLGHGASPSSSTKSSPVKESTSDDSDDNTPLAQYVAKKAAEKETKGKKRPAKRKKKKDPNEPQKPVSAYALFFRDTQAAIKGQNPNATFGEVSKIVASMWDSLDAEQKQAYKQRTEVAKKEYLKKLAAYRASLVSKAAVDQAEPEKSPTKQKKVSSPPLTTHPPHSMPRIIAPKPPHMPLAVSMSSGQQPIMHPQIVQNPIGGPMPMTYSQGHGDSMMMSAQSQMPVGSNGMSAAMCTRSGCNKPAIISPDWDNEYCSNECVVSHWMSSQRGWRHPVQMQQWYTR